MQSCSRSSMEDLWAFLMVSHFKSLVLKQDDRPHHKLQSQDILVLAQLCHEM